MKFTRMASLVRAGLSVIFRGVMSGERMEVENTDLCHIPEC